MIALLLFTLTSLASDEPTREMIRCDIDRHIAQVEGHRNQRLQSQERIANLMAFIPTGNHTLITPTERIRPTSRASRPWDSEQVVLGHSIYISTFILMEFHDRSNLYVTTIVDRTQIGRNDPDHLPILRVTYRYGTEREGREDFEAAFVWLAQTFGDLSPGEIP